MQFSPEQIERLKVTSLEIGLGECTRLIVFDANCTVLYSTCPVRVALLPLPPPFPPSDHLMSASLMLCGFSPASYYRISYFLDALRRSAGPSLQNVSSYMCILQVENPQELQSLVLALGPREEAMKRGMRLQGQRHEVRATPLHCCQAGGQLPQTIASQWQQLQGGPVMAPRLRLCAVQVHRHHPPLVWGRMHSADPEQNTGIAVCETDSSFGSRKLFAVITYECVSVPT